MLVFEAGSETERSHWLPNSLSPFSSSNHPPVVMCQLVGDLGQVAPPILPGNSCLVQLSVAVQRKID